MDALGQSGTVLRIAVVTAGVSDPSSTRMLAARIAEQSLGAVEAAGAAGEIQFVELAPLAVDIARSVTSRLTSAALEEAIATVAAADAVIVATPVYKAGISGLLKSFVDVLDEDLLIATPVILSATAESSRHAMVLDGQLRPLLAFMRALPTPTSVFAAPEDWGSPELSARVRRAATELAQMLISRVGERITDATWAQHRHGFAGRAVRAERSTDLDFDTDLMRLATGGGASHPAGGQLH
ncbi:CE1759 family FMN reductase [Herbiconiux ginsengi]|uniref:FMN reductase n=1 Tax=Herbiconiux ginsengi TaxID=381665 RepID=A0A1H3LX39_9MICO|nr:CE1759 family FMN reductase [Herbiconiux ginsengi]SDY68558.1 FMN reductase [Herbiconiux ginsengi]